jgi:exosortase H (IPTLxxWG-CTERM-specific)
LIYTAIRLGGCPPPGQNTRITASKRRKNSSFEREDPKTASVWQSPEDRCCVRPSTQSPFQRGPHRRGPLFFEDSGTGATEVARSSRRLMPDVSPETQMAIKRAPRGSKQVPPEPVSMWQEHRKEITFLGLFLLLLGGSFALLSLNSVNDRVVEPFTALVARASGVGLNLLGHHVELQGTIIRSDRFAVNIRNGCNGVESMLLFVAAVLAFPVSWRSRLLGLGVGSVAIQLVNLVRVMALFLTGVYFPKLFDASHTVIWQSLVILFAVLLFILWANRWARRRVSAAAESAEVAAR